MARCMHADILTKVLQEITSFLGETNPMRSFLILLASLFIAYWVSKLITKIIVKIAQAIAVRADNTSNDERFVQLRQVETFLSVSLAIIRVLIVVAVGYVVWSTFSDSSNPSIAAIGASVVFLVIAGGTIGPLLRDITAGSTMIIERWFSVGDYIRVEPFLEVGGVVERVTLRSTQLRSLNGEVIHLHNQHIQGVRVTPRGVRTLAIDIFVNNKELGERLINSVISTIPTGPLTLAQPLRIVKSEKWGDELWHLTVRCKTPPGREWLVENFFVEAIIDADSKGRKKPLLVHKPLVHFADAAAERSFRRAVRVTKEESR